MSRRGIDGKESAIVQEEDDSLRISSESKEGWRKIIEIRDVGQEDPRRRRRVERSHTEHSEISGRCFKCGKAGHFPYQCHNYKCDQSLNEPVSPGVSSSEEKERRKIRKKEKKKRKKKKKKEKKRRERKKRKREKELIENEDGRVKKKRKLD